MSPALGVGCLGSRGKTGWVLERCEIFTQEHCQLLIFGRLAIITLISRCIHVQCIHDDRDCEGVWGYLTWPTSQVVARGELIPLRI